MNTAVSSNEISLFLLVMARAGGLVASSPIIGDSQVPRSIKVALTLALSIVLVQIPSVDHSTAPSELVPFSIAVLAQALIGLVLGFVGRMVFFALQTAGGIVSLVMGLSISAVLDPLTRASDSALTQLYMIVASMTFLAVNGDALVVAAMARSFDLAPLDAQVNAGPMAASLVTDTALVTQIGVQIALPVAASLIAANVLLGIVSRSMPQLNLFILAMPINMLLGMFALLGGLGGMLIVTGDFMQDLPRNMLSILSTSR